MRQSTTFAQEMGMLHPSHVCLLAQDQTLTVRDFLNKAQALKKRTKVMTGASVAIRGLQPLEMVIAAAAFDGVASQMLLLPTSLDETNSLSLIKRTGCSHVLDGSEMGFRTLQSVVTSTDNTLPTKWLLATSGTTRSPKLIHHTLATLTRTVKRKKQLRTGYIWGLFYDPCRFAGLQVVLQALLSSSKLVLTEQADYDDQLSVMIQHQVNALSATPTMWRKLLMDGRVVQLPLCQITIGGEVTDQTIIDGLKKIFPAARVTHIYASTETGTAFSVSDGRAGFPAAWLNNANHNPAMRVDDNQILRIKPTVLPTGAEISNRLDADGYLVTEDLVSVNTERVYFMGRASGAINVGGNKVNPEEVEVYLRRIECVIDARVFARSNSIMGQLVVAEVVANETDRKLLRRKIMQKCREDLKSWQVPALITFVQELNVISTGKKERLIQ